MATKTGLLGLTKPAYTDAADIAVLNTNFDLIDNAAGNGARVHNLLDNGWFVNPVNQRGAASYTGTGGKVYTIDRWYTWSPYISVSVEDGFVSVTSSSDNDYSNLTQVIPSHQMTGKPVTMVLCDTDDRVYCASGVLTQDASITNAESDVFWMRVTMDNYGNIAVAIIPRAGKTVKIKYVALYPGAYTAETLPAYVPKGYAAEWNECRRYFRRDAAVCTVGTQYDSDTHGLITIVVSGMRALQSVISVKSISGQGWGNIQPANLTAGWNTTDAGLCYANFFVDIASPVAIGQTIMVTYEANADL